MNIQSDNAFVRGLTRLVNIVTFGVLYLLCCVPAITVGAASISLSVIMRRLKDGEPVTYGEFLRGIKRYFRQGTVLWLITAAALGITAACFYTYGMFDPISWPLYILGVCVGTLCLLVLPWLFGCAGYFETDSGHMLVFAYYLALKHLGYTFLLILILYGILIAGVLTVVALPVVPGIIAYLQAGTYNQIFKRYKKENLQEIPKNENETDQ